jgi:hypothetical protein
MHRRLRGSSLFVICVVLGDRGDHRDVALSPSPDSLLSSLFEPLAGAFGCSYLINLGFCGAAYFDRGVILAWVSSFSFPVRYSGACFSGIWRNFSGLVLIFLSLRKLRYHRLLKHGTLSDHLPSSFYLLWQDSWNTPGGTAFLAGATVRLVWGEPAIGGYQGEQMEDH